MYWHAFSTHVVALAAWLLHASVAATVVAAVVFAMQLMLGRWLTPAWRYRLWGLVVLRLLLPALPASPTSISNLNTSGLLQAALGHLVHQKPDASVESPVLSHDSKISTVVTYEAPPLSREAISAGGIQHHAATQQVVLVRWPLVLAALWILVTAVLLVRLIAANCSLARRLRKAMPIADRDVLALLDECRRSVGIARSTPVLITDAIRIPAAAGVWRPKILLPPGLFDRLESNEQRLILLHELSHIRCHDVAMNWLLAMVQIMHWFNPFIRLAFHRLRADREIARDAAVLWQASPNDVSTSADCYGRLLLTLTQSLSSFPHGSASVVGIAGIVTPPPALLPGLFEKRSGLGRRLNMLVELQRLSRPRSAAGAVLALVLAVVTLTRAQVITSAASDPKPVQEQGLSKKVRIVKDETPPVDEALDKVAAEVRFESTPFSDVIDYFRDKTCLNIFVNWKSLEAAGIDRKTPVSLQLRQVKLSKALATVVDSMGVGKSKLAYQVDERVITIVAAADQMKNVSTRVYDVRDLLVEVPDFVPRDVPAPATHPSDANAIHAANREDVVNAVLRLIEETVDSESWKDRGGTIGSIAELHGQLVVTQTPENQLLIRDLLDQLRETHGLQVTIDARYISCDRQLFQKLASEWEAAPVANSKPTQQAGSASTRPAAAGATYFLTEVQVDHLMHTVETSSEAALISSPRITLFNGQRAFVQVTSPRSYIRDYAFAQTAAGETRYEPIYGTVDPGVVMDVQATISANRKSVVLTLRPKVSVMLGMKRIAWPGRPAGSLLMVDEPLIKSSKLQTTISVPDSGTLLLGGMEDPGIGRDVAAAAATQPAGKPHYLFLLVKPKLILGVEASAGTPESKAMNNR